MRWNSDYLALGIAQGSQAPTEDAACIYIYGVVEPLEFGNRGVAVDDKGFAAVVS